MRWRRTGKLGGDSPGLGNNSWELQAFNRSYGWISLLMDWKLTVIKMRKEGIEMTRSWPFFGTMVGRYSTMDIVVTGYLAAQEGRMPKIKQVALDTGLSYVTVSKTLRYLENEGVVTIQRKEGKKRIAGCQFSISKSAVLGESYDPTHETSTKPGSDESGEDEGSEDENDKDLKEKAGTEVALLSTYIVSKEGSIYSKPVSTIVDTSSLRSDKNSILTFPNKSSSSYKKEDQGSDATGEPIHPITGDRIHPDKGESESKVTLKDVAMAWKRACEAATGRQYVLTPRDFKSAKAIASMTKSIPNLTEAFHQTVNWMLHPDTWYEQQHKKTGIPVAPKLSAFLAVRNDVLAFFQDAQEAPGRTISRYSWGE